ARRAHPRHGRPGGVQAGVDAHDRGGPECAAAQRRRRRRAPARAHAPGQQAHQRVLPEGAGSARLQGHPQHRALRQHDRGHHPAALGRGGARRPTETGGPGADGGVRSRHELGRHVAAGVNAKERAPARSSLFVELAVVLASLLLAAAESRIWNDFNTRFYGGGLGDPGQHAWALASETRQMLRAPWHPFEGNVYYPSHASLLYGDPLLGPAVLVLPGRLFSSDPVLLYNLAVLLSLTLCSLTSYRL